jgi:hypothetical protein
MIFANSMNTSRPKIVVYSNRGLTSIYVQSLVEQMKCLIQYKDQYDIVFATLSKSDMIIREVELLTDLTFSETIDIKSRYDNEVFTKKYPTWTDFYNNEDWFAQLDNVKHIIIYGGILSSAGGLTRGKTKINHYLKSDKKMAYMALGQYFSSVLQLIKLAKRCDSMIHELVYDPCEVPLDHITLEPFVYPKYKLYHGYDIERYRIQRLDSLQYFLLESEKSRSVIGEVKKDYDIVFGFTAITKDREKSYDRIKAFLNSLSNLKILTFEKHKRLGIDTFVDRDTYLSFIERARFTFIIPPYDLTHFSIYRFVESVYNNCLPLIGNDVKIDEWISSFDLDPVMVAHLIFDYETLPQISEEERLELLDYFKSKLLVVERHLDI